MGLCEAVTPWFWLLAPIVVYLGARIVFVAYFHAKRDHLRRIYRGIDEKNRSTDRSRG